MPHFTLQLGPDGPMLTAYLGVSQARGAALKSAGQDPPQMIQIRALVDTGASCTCADPDVIATLQLPQINTVQVNTPSTGNQPHMAGQYDAALVIPSASDDHQPLIFPTISIIAADLKLQGGLQALIGRDILSLCLLHYNGERGFFTLAY